MLPRPSGASTSINKGAPPPELYTSHTMALSPGFLRFNLKIPDITDSLINDVSSLINAQLDTIQRDEHETKLGLIPPEENIGKQSGCPTFLMPLLHPMQARHLRFNLREIFRLMVEMAMRDLHAATLALINRRTAGVRAQVVLAGRPSLLHGGWMVKPLGLTVAVSRPLTAAHTVFSAARDHVATHPGVRHLIHVRYKVVHDGEPQKSTMKKRTSRSVRSRGRQK